MKKELLFFVCIIVFALSSCKTSFPLNEYLDRTVGLEEPELLDIVLDYDNRFPENPWIKKDLTILFLQKDEETIAKSYLESAIKNINKARKDKQLQYDIYYLAANMELFYENDDIAYRYINLAMEIEPRNEALLLKARLELNKDNPQIYLDNIDNLYPLLARSDLKNLLYFFNNNKRDKESIDMLNIYKEKFGYDEEMLLYQAIVFDKNGEYVKSLLSNFCALFIMMNRGIITKTEAISNLNDSRQEVLDADIQNKEDCLYCIDTMEALLDNSTDLSSKLKEIKVDADFDVYKYFELLVATREKKYSKIDDISYLEIAFRNDPYFYHLLWENIKNTNSFYGIDLVAPILEKTILLAPNSDFSQSARKELCYLNGMSLEHCELLLIPGEMDYLVERYFENRRFEEIVPIINMLIFENNRYTDIAILCLKELAKDESVRNMLIELEKNSQGIIKIRMSNILASFE